MTWILYHQIGFGPYFPDGTYVDVDGKMEAEFKRTNPDIDAESAALALLKFRRANRLSPEKPTEPAKDFQKPQKFVLAKPVKALADVMITERSLMVVSEPVKKIIEGFEPDTHQFWPVEIETKKGKPASDMGFFAILVLQSRDGLRPEASRKGSVKETHSYSNMWSLDDRKACLEGVAIEQSAVSGAHLWYEERALGGAFFMSDDLSAALRQGNFRLPPKFHRCMSA